MDRLAPPPSPAPATPCPNPKCWANPEPTVICRMCGTAKTGAAVAAAFRRILAGETT